MIDSKGAIYKGRKEGMNKFKDEVAVWTNPNKLKGPVSSVIKGADIFIGVSQPDVLSENDVLLMNNKPIIFAMANPDPEISPEVALKAGAFIMATGRSDYPNQINNVLAFPGIFRGALDVRASDINDDMKLAAAYALAAIVKEPTKDRIIPSPFDDVAPVVAKAVMKAARDSGVARI